MARTAAPTKFVEDPVDGTYGTLALFYKGLEGFVGLPDVNVLHAMMREHASTETFTPSNNTGTHPSLPTP